MTTRLFEPGAVVATPGAVDLGIDLLPFTMALF